MSDALKYLLEHIDDDPQVNVRWNPQQRLSFFERIATGDQLDLGWQARTYGARLSHPHDVTLQLRWLPNYRNQDLATQIQYFNIFYRVEGLDEPDQVFHTGIHDFLGARSLVLSEYLRLRNIEKARREITLGEAAQERLKELLAQAPA